MRYWLLGNSGLRVSQICLGTMTFGGEHAGAAVDAAAARAQFDAFRESGGNFLDTANMYSRGESERLTADLIATCRDEIVLASKFTMSMRSDDPNAGGSSRKNLCQALDASLGRLKTEAIDLYWVHANDPHTPLEETLRSLDDAVRAGKIRYVGISNMPAWRIAQAQMLCRYRGWAPVSALQLQYSLIERSIEADFFPMATEFGMAVTAWSPLGGGVLSGKYAKAGDGAPRGRLDTVPRYGKTMLSDRNLEIAALVAKIAEDTGVKPATVALAWVLQKGVIPIVGATRLAQLQANLAAADLTLTADHVSALDEATAPPPQYPHNLWPRINDMQFGTVHQQVDAVLPGGG